ncbi:MAG: alpha-E domain-containing protein [Eubacteriales bacterium]|nr:alpha-E domain-containing protein [Eubacteriales bacterium]
MGVISIEQTDRLFWLGRYTERVYTTIRLFDAAADRMLDGLPGGGYAQFCQDLEIPNIYESNEDFQKRYAFDTEDENSIVSNLNRAYDNAIVLRELIGSDTLSYVQLAIYDMKKAGESRAPLLEMQKIRDNLLAFWGIADDEIESEDIRNIIKVGKRVERIDLYARLRQPREDMIREVSRLVGRIDRSSVVYVKEHLERLKEMIQEQDINYNGIIVEIESLIMQQN